MGRVDDRRARRQAAGPLQQLDWPAAVLCEALLDLAGLLVGVDVERQALPVGAAADLLQPVGRAGADGVGARPTRIPSLASCSTCDRYSATDAWRIRSRPPRAPRRAPDSGTRRPPCRRPLASPGSRVRMDSRTSAGSCRSASASTSSRQAQKSPPPARPRRARWNVCVCALTNPGNVSVAVTAGDASSTILVVCPPARSRPGSQRSRTR